MRNSFETAALLTDLKLKILESAALAEMSPEISNFIADLKQPPPWYRVLFQPPTFYSSVIVSTYYAYR